MKTCNVCLIRRHHNHYSHISSHLSLSLWQAVWSLGYLVSAIGDGVLCGACGLPAAHLLLKLLRGTRAVLSELCSELTTG